MFEVIRKHSKFVMGLLFLLVFPSFVLWGIEGNRFFSEQAKTVASVDGHDISQADWDNAHRREVDRLRASNPTIDAKLFDSPQARYATLEQLVHQRVLAAAAQKFHLIASDQQLAEALEQNPTIAALRKPDGTLDMSRYTQLLAAQGMTPESFEAGVRNDLSLQQVIGGLTSTSFATPAEADVALDAFYQQREIQVVRFDTKDYASKVSLSDAELLAYYKSHEAAFQAPAQASIQYVVLNLDAVKNSITLDPQEVRAYYDQNAARLSGQEQRRASHILIAVPKNATPAEREKAKAKADEILAMARKDPANFAELAKKYSQDPGSAANGGDLGFFTRDAMVKPFADAVWGMKKGEIVGPIETDYGYHIIELTGIEEPKQRSFDELKPQIESDLKNQQAQVKFADAADKFTNMVYEQSDSLQPVADKLKLKIQTATGVTRTPAPGATGVLANEKFLNALFASDAVQKKRNTDAVEVGNNELVSGRITQYTASHLRSFDEVKDEVRRLLLAERGAALARTEGAAKLAAWKADPASAQLPPAVVVSREQMQKLPVAVVDAALRADAGKLPSFIGVDLGAQGYAVVKLEKIVPRTPPAADVAAQQRAQLAQAVASAEGQAYYDLLKARFKATIKVPPPPAVAPGAPTTE
ncbi:MAG: Peptidyl-prolyl cis-trans isomerase PpiD [Burkholderiaceae bacterium]|jgi:peptidyl-prolyl cis-trans isomerase D|nr:MAG: Peptidyl-prolyl cis-trans isomerase PpiD [Burkholderiaceae bacterium]